MAYDVTALTDYVDELKNDLITEMVAQGRTASIVQIQTGIKNSATINILDTDVIFQADGCTRAPAGDTPLTQRAITVGDIAVHEDLCPKDLNKKYTQFDLRPGSTQEDVPFEEVYIGKKVALIMEQLDIADWQGDTGGAGNLAFYDGFLKIIDAAAGVVSGNTSGTTAMTGITSGNVIGLLTDMYLAAPESISEAGDIRIWVGNDTFKKYQKAIVDGNLFHYRSEDGNSLDLPLIGFDGVTVSATRGLSGTDRMILAQDSNLFIGMDMEGEEEEFEVWYSKDDRVVKFTTAWKRGTQIAFPGQIVQFTLVP